MKILKEQLLGIGFFIENKKYYHREGYRFDLNEQILYHHNDPDDENDYFCLKPNNTQDIIKEISLNILEQETINQYIIN